ncbi:DUF4209 domain-containing protein [uncultured Fibrobacter sp.]|uniref:DUF4209 domain-containing protein n=1 Tax=uncultured Fibrobacter sp. TaxID=261512 RepID=UPI002626082D|nr:DUF4209 domain-containing protein [uncultured Fibrobacter sp.]
MQRKELENIEYRIDALECSRYAEVLSKEVEAPTFPFCLFQKIAEKEKDPFKSKILWLLSDILSLGLDCETNEFIPYFFFRLENLNESDVEFLIVFLNKIDDPYIKSRIADVLFCKTKQFQPYLSMAIDAYMEMPIGSKNWNLYMQDAWQRALFLVKTRCKKRLGEFKSLFVEFVIKTSNKNIEPLMWALVNVFDANDLKTHSAALDNCVKIIRYYIPRIAFSVIGSWSKAIDKIAEVDQNIADSLYEELINDRLPYFANEIKSGFFVRAHEINQLFPLLGKMSKNKRAEFQDKEQWMIKKSRELYQKAMQFEGKRYSEYANLERREKMEKFLSKCNPALLFVTLLKVMKFDKKTFESIIKSSSDLKNGLTFAIESPMNVLNEDGGIVSSNREQSNKDLFEKDCIAKEFQKYVFKQSTECLEPIFKELTKQCSLSYKDAIDQLLTHSSYLTETNVSAFARGWVYGCQGDLFTALHLMVPHFDRLLTDLLKVNDVPVMGKNKETNEDFEKSPKKFLDTNEAIKILGEETAFQIKMLFYSELGFDYRNRIAHGRITSDSYEQPYIWAFILKFLLDKAGL